MFTFDVPISTHKNSGLYEKNNEHKNIYAFSLAIPHGKSLFY